jgi:hypothetical protein
MGMPDGGNGDFRPLGPLCRLQPPLRIVCGSQWRRRDLREAAICGDLCESEASSLLNTGEKSSNRRAAPQLDQTNPSVETVSR